MSYAIKEKNFSERARADQLRFISFLQAQREPITVLEADWIIKNLRSEFGEERYQELHKLWKAEQEARRRKRGRASSAAS